MLWSVSAACCPAKERRRALRELCAHIRQLDRDLSQVEPELRELYGGADPGDEDQGVGACAWGLSGAINGGSWSDVVGNAAHLEAALSPL